MRPSFYRLIRDILRFHREAPSLLGESASTITRGDYLTQGRYSRSFCNQYLIPMGAAIWSTSPGQMLSFPARYFVEFFRNHGLLAITDRPQWRVVTGGSWKYVERLTAPFRQRIRLNCPVLSIRRRAESVDVTSTSGTESYDHVVLATHGDQALRLLSDADGREREILSHFTCQKNVAVLHTDASLLPRRRLAWASWNYHLPREPLDAVAVTYQMNILQGLMSAEPFCVTLNREDAIRADKIYGRFVYEHPVYTPGAVQAQKRHGEISGHSRTHFCGAYWGYGFHEDGVNSAQAVAKSLGVTDGWG